MSESTRYDRAERSSDAARGPQIWRRLLRSALTWGLVAAALAIWQIQAWRGALDRGTLPPPARVVEALVDLAESGELAHHSIASTRRVLTGYLVASTIAIGVCLLVARLPLAFLPIRRLVDVLRPIPPLAWIPLAIFWFGIGGRGPIFIVAIGAFFPIVIVLLDAVRTPEPHFVETALTLGSRPNTIAFRVVIPLAVPQIVSGLRVGLGVAWTSVIAAELVVGQDGLGYLLNANRLLLRSDIVVASMLMIGIVGLLLSIGFELIQRLALRRWS